MIIFNSDTISIALDDSKEFHLSDDALRSASEVSDLIGITTLSEEDIEKCTNKVFFISQRVDLLMCMIMINSFDTEKQSEPVRRFSVILANICSYVRGKSSEISKGNPDLFCIHAHLADFHHAYGAIKLITEALANEKLKAEFVNSVFDNIKIQ